LNADDQRVIKLVHFEQKTTAQISALTGWNFSTVKVRSFRARNKLKKLLAEHNS
jgi:RNA polymerase sigma-70 factor (ECF subfamily)